LEIILSDEKFSHLRDQEECRLMLIAVNAGKMHGGNRSRRSHFLRGILQAVGLGAGFGVVEIKLSDFVLSYLIRDNTAPRQSAVILIIMVCPIQPLFCPPIKPKAVLRPRQGGH
jgi:hypothetical protein